MDFSLCGGTQVMGYISPFDTNDTYAVTDPLYSIDGFRNVADVAALNAIPDLRRRAGMVVGISSGTTYYKLNPGPWWGSISDDWTEFTPGTTTKVYKAILNQSGTGNPTVTNVIENTFGYDPVFTRAAFQAGRYTFTLTGIVVEKTIITGKNVVRTFDGFSGAILTEKWINFGVSSNNNGYINTFDYRTRTVEDDILDGWDTFIHIETTMT